MKFLVLFLFCFNSYAVGIGKEAPNFSLVGFPSSVELSKYKGKYVVLEWYNDGCPYVRKHYDSKNMQRLQEKFKSKVTWLSINSSAPGKQGHLASSSSAKSIYKKEKMKSFSLLLDSNGKTGVKYEAKTTPHMYIIDPGGKLIYQGAIDSIASADKTDINLATNYVDQALNQSLAGKKITNAKTKAYGCSVKY
jgi:thioredoxin-related protein